MCQVHTGTFVSLLAPEKNYDTACHPEKNTTYQGIYYTWYLSLRIRSSNSSQLERREEKKRKDKTKRGSKERKGGKNTILFFFFFFSFFFRTLLLSSFWTSRGHKCRPFSSPVLAFNFIAHRVRQSHCSSIFHRVLLTHALALSASQFVRKKKSPRIYTSMHSAGFELTKLTYTRLEDNLIRHPGDQLILADPRN